METAGKSNRSFDLPQRRSTRASSWRAQGKILLGNRSMHCSTSCIHAVVGNRSMHCSTSSAAVPDAALPPPSLESCIHAVVGNRSMRGSSSRIHAVVALFILVLSSGASYAGDLNLLINGKAFHINAPAGAQFNERNWGAGVQYDFDPIGIKKNWIPLAMASGFQDSFKNPSYYAGGGLMRRFLPFSAFNNFHVDAGVVAFLMTREDYKDNDPFLGILPALSIGTQRVSLNLTYVPKVHPKMVQLIFIQLKVGLGRAK